MKSQKPTCGWVRCSALFGVTLSVCPDKTSGYDLLTNCRMSETRATINGAICQPHGIPLRSQCFSVGYFREFLVDDSDLSVAVVWIGPVMLPVDSGITVM